MNRRWLVRSNGQIRGPWTTEEVSLGIRQKKISAIDEVCLPGERWQYVRQVEEFQNILQNQVESNDEVTLTDHGPSIGNETLQETIQIQSSVQTEIIERKNMQRNQKILILLTLLTIVCMILLFITLQKSFHSKESQELTALQAEQVEARELANLAMWANNSNVKAEERLEVFKKINQWRIKHQYARRELLIYEIELAKKEKVEQSVLDRLAYELTSVSFRPAKSDDLLLGPQPESFCLQAGTGIENSAIKSNYEIICQLMFGDLNSVKEKLPLSDEVTQQNNRQLLLLMIEYYIKIDQYQTALDLIKKYQLTGTGLEESLRFQVCTKISDSLCTTSPAK